MGIRCRIACVPGVVLMLLSGCALVDQKVPLVYGQASAGVRTQSSGDIRIEKPVPPELTVKGKGLAVIGSVKNTYGMKTADTVTTDSVSDWVAQALRTELEAAGFKPTVVDDISVSPDNGIKTRIIKVWVEQDPGFWTVGAIGEVQLRMALYREGKKVKEFDVESKGQGSRSMVGDETTKRDSLKVALETCMKKAVPIIVETYSKE
jgi:hypothetical protein